MYGTTILLKQTTGLVLAIVFIGYKILNVRNINELKKYLKIMGVRAGGVLIPIIIFAIYLTYNGIWGDFLDYAVFGVSTFSNTVSYENILDGVLYTALGIIFPILLFVLIIIYSFSMFNKKYKDKKWAINLQILLVYSLASATVMYPIADKNHFSIGSICTLIIFVYLLYYIVTSFFERKKEEKLKFIVKTFIEALAVFTLTFSTVSSVISLKQYVVEIKDKEYAEHFKYIPTNEELIERINTVDEYILDKKAEGKEVYILDTMAVVFIIPTGEYHKNYDMFNLGNFGSEGEERNN